MDNYYHVVLDALTKASSQNAELLKIAERQLKCWETGKEFYSTLLSIACDKNVDLNIRWLSVLCIKNGVDCYWRKNAPNAIASDEKDTIKHKLLTCFNDSVNAIASDEKDAIKHKLLTCFNDPVNQLALQFSVIIGKIARFDFEGWPELFTVLLNGTQSADEIHQLRALLTLHHVVKAVDSKRLTADRRVFHQLTSSIFHLWINYSKLFLQEANKDFFKLKELLDSCFLTLKILRKLVVNGFKDCLKETDSVYFLSLIFQQIGPFLECRSYLKDRENILETLEKYLVLLIKILRGVLEFQPFAFVQCIRPALEFSATFCFNKSFEVRLFEKLIVQFLNLIKEILVCLKYKPFKLIQGTLSAMTKHAMGLEAHKIIVEFFTFPVLKEICDQLLSRYFLLSEHDITSWEYSPEEFASDEGGESWKLSLRPCTEAFFLTFFHAFRNLLTPLVVETIKNVQNNSSRDLIGILKKDAIYNAVGLAAFDMYNEVDFDNWFTSTLISELRVKDPGYYIIRRRVIWLIGKWVSDKMSPELRSVLYEVILELLNTDENLIVRLAAANTLKIAVDHYEFSVEQFLPYLEKNIAALFHLLKEVKKCDLKMSVLHVLSSIITRIRTEIRPFLEALLQYLPQLWNNCGEHNMLRCAIIAFFVNLVEGLGTLSETLHPILLPMIALSTDVTQPPHVYLLEDGLQLWWAVVDNTSKYTEELISLAANMMPLLEYKGENLNICLQITEFYVVLCPGIFLKRYGQTLVQIFLSAVTDMEPKAIDMVLKVVETAFIVFPEDGPVLFEPMLPFVLSLAFENHVLPISFSVYMSLLSRVILHNQTCFGNILQKRANESRKDAGIVLGELLDIWLDKMPLLNSIQRRKLMGLALTCLLTSNSDVVHERIRGIFLSVVEVLNDIIPLTKSENGVLMPDLLVMNPDDFSQQDEDIESEQDRRKQELSRQDPVHTVVLRDYLYNQVMALQQSVGATKFQELMSTVDVETMQQLEGYFKN